MLIFVKLKIFIYQKSVKKLYILKELQNKPFKNYTLF